MTDTQQTPTYPTIEAALNADTTDDLKRLIDFFDVSKKPTRKGDLAGLILQQYEGAGLQALWTRLDDLQQKAVAEVVHSGGYAYDGARFAAKYGQEPDWGKKRGSTGILYGSYERRFSLLHLFFFHGEMPADLKERLKAFVPEPAPTALHSQDAAPETVPYTWQTYVGVGLKRETHHRNVPVIRAEMEGTAQEDLVSILRLIDAGKVPVSDKTRLPTGAATKEIGGLLDGGDFYTQPEAIAERDDAGMEIGPIRAFAWPMLLQAGGLADLSGKRLTLSPAGKKALTANPAEVLRALWKKWLSNTLLDELRRIDVVKGQTGRGQRSLTSPSRRRAVIARALADCPTGQWVAAHDFLRYMIAAGYDFEVTRDPWTLYVSDPNYGSLGYDSSVDVLFSRYILCLLFEYAATLGMIDVAYVPPELGIKDYGDMWGTDDLDFFSRYDGLASLRLTPLGAYCLGLAKTYAPAPMEIRPVLRVLPNQEIVQTGERLTAGDLLALNLYAKEVSDSVWRLDQPRMLAALEAGHEIGKLREFLYARTGADLPDTVAQFLRDVEGRGRQLSDAGPARLIECRDPATAALIANDSRTRRHCLPAGDRHLAVPDDQEAAFRRGLRSLGYVLFGKR